VEKRKGFTFIKEFPDTEPIVDMITHRDNIFVATVKSVYIVKDNVLVPLEIAHKYHVEGD
jgi:hypothetical protein